MFLKSKFFIVSIITAFFFSSCSSVDDTTLIFDETVMQRVVSDGTSHIIYAGQFINVGNVTAKAEGENLLVTFTITESDWELTEAQLWVGTTPDGYPQTKKGSPKIGNFPFNAGDITGAVTYSFLVPLSSLGITNTETCEAFTLYFMAHCSVQRLDENGNVIQTETGWAGTERVLDRGSWATRFSMTFTCENDDDDDQGSCETAFAYGNTCFLSIDLNNDGRGDFNRWGWSIGPLSEGTTTHDIYAGAGQCDTNKGTFVGTLTLTYEGGNLKASYQMISGFTMSETHLYAGNDLLAKDVKGDYTVAPGQYGNLHELSASTSDSYTLSGLSGDIYVVAHAVVCGF